MEENLTQEVHEEKNNIEIPEELEGLSPESTAEIMKEVSVSKEESLLEEAQIEKPVDDEAQAEPKEKEEAQEERKAPAHIPYERFKEVNDEKKAASEEIARLKSELELARQQPQPRAQNPQKDQEEIKRAIQLKQEIGKYSFENSLKDLGYTTEQIEEMRYLDDDISKRKLAEFNEREQAYTLYAQEKIAEQKAIEVQEQVRRQRLIEEAAPAIQEYRKDPAFNEIDTMMTTYYEQLPFAQAQAIVQAVSRIQSGRFDQNDLNVVDAYYHATHKAYYAKTKAPEKPKQNKIEQIKAHPRTDQIIEGGNSPEGTTLADIEKMLNDPNVSMDDIPLEIRKMILV